MGRDPGTRGAAWGFQNQHYGLFLIATIAGLAFWMIEAVMKRHQMRYYIRMREIEVIGFNIFAVELADGSLVSTPQIDWSWATAILPREKDAEVWAPPARSQLGWAYTWSWVLPHIFFPHLMTVIAGGVLFVLGVMRILRMPL